MFGWYSFYFTTEEAVAESLPTADQIDDFPEPVYEPPELESEEDSMAVVDSFDLEELEAQEVPEVTPAPVQSSGGNFLVIYGSYQDESRARTAIGQLPFDCFECEVLYIEPYYKVVVYRGQTRAEAQTQLNSLAEQGVNGFIQHYQN